MSHSVIAIVRGSHVVIVAVRGWRRGGERAPWPLALWMLQEFDQLGITAHVACRFGGGATALVASGGVGRVRK